jgi:hypothetical protein
MGKTVENNGHLGSKFLNSKGLFPLAQIPENLKGSEFYYFKAHPSTKEPTSSTGFRVEAVPFRKVALRQLLQWEPPLLLVKQQLACDMRESLGSFNYRPINDLNLNAMSLISSALNRGRVRYFGTIGSGLTTPLLA